MYNIVYNIQRWLSIIVWNSCLRWSRIIIEDNSKYLSKNGLVCTALLSLKIWSTDPGVLGGGAMGGGSGVGGVQSHNPNKPN